MCCECPTVTLPLGKIADDDGEATTTRGMNPGRRWSVTGPGGPAPTPGPEGGPLRRCRWGCGLVTHWWLARPTLGAALPLREELPYALRRTVHISTTIGGRRGRYNGGRGDPAGSGAGILKTLLRPSVLRTAQTGATEFDWLRRPRFTSSGRGILGTRARAAAPAGLGYYGGRPPDTSQASGRDARVEPDQWLALNLNCPYEGVGPRTCGRRRLGRRLSGGLGTAEPRTI